MKRYASSVRCKYCVHYIINPLYKGTHCNKKGFYEDCEETGYCYDFQLSSAEQFYAKIPPQHQRYDGSFIIDPHDDAMESDQRIALWEALRSAEFQRKAEKERQREERRIETERQLEAMERQEAFWTVVLFIGGSGLLLYIFWPLIADVLEIVEALGDLLH